MIAKLCRKIFLSCYLVCFKGVNFFTCFTYSTSLLNLMKWRLSPHRIACRVEFFHSSVVIIKFTAYKIEIRREYKIQVTRYTLFFRRRLLHFLWTTRPSIERMKHVRSFFLHSFSRWLWERIWMNERRNKWRLKRRWIILIILFNTRHNFSAN